MIDINDYRVEIKDVGYFVFVEVFHKDTGKQFTIETNKDELTSLVNYLNDYIKDN